MRFSELCISLLSCLHVTGESGNKMMLVSTLEKDDLFYILLFKIFLSQEEGLK